MQIDTPFVAQRPNGFPFGALLKLARSYRIKPRTRSLLSWPANTLKIRAEEWLQEAALAEPERTLRLIRKARRVSPERLFPAQCEALLTARTAGWAAAAPLFREIAAREGPGRRFAGAQARTLLAPAKPCPAVRLALPAAGRQAALTPVMARGIVVYTASFGARPHLPPLFGAPDGLRFLCFTDQETAARGWEVVRAAPPPGGEAHYRIRPHAALAEAAAGVEASLYVAADRLAVGNLHTLFARWLLPQDFALWRHPHCIDWHDLAERLLLTADGPAEEVVALAQACEAEATPRSRGACDTGVLWRHHARPEVQAAMEAWWSIRSEAPGPSDLTLYRLLHGASPPSVLPAILPDALGPAEDSIFFARQPPPRRKHGPVVRPGPSGRIPVAFLYSDRRPHMGITLLRGRQLSSMIAERFPDLYDVTFTADISALRDRVVIVNRDAILYNSLEAIGGLKERNCTLISDWQDRFSRPKNKFFDAHMALSIRQMLDFGRIDPETPAYHVTHHVNRDVPACIPPKDRLRTAYFGDPNNTVLPEALAGSVDVFTVKDASFTARHWTDAAPNYNCHWIVRNLRHEWRKPFLKGFVAARCGAVVIVTRDDMNAAHYLGDDYPFYADGVGAADLELAWTRVASAFGGPDWCLAQAIMQQVAARSSDAQVCDEFRFMLSEVLNGR